MTTTYSNQAQDIVNGAFQVMGVYSVDAVPTAADNTIALATLERMVKAWSAAQMNLWLTTTVTVPLVANQAIYTLGPSGGVVTDRPMQLMQAWRRNTSTNIDTPLDIISRDAYNMLSTKALTTGVGVPTQAYYQPTLTNGTLNLYVVPDATTASSTVVILNVAIAMADVGVITNVMQFPNEWYEALELGLAKRLGLKYSIPSEKYAAISAQADTAYQLMLDWGQNEEDVGVYFSPDYRGGMM